MKSKTNPPIVEAFLNHQVAEGFNLNSTGDKLISFRTTIAQWIKGKLVINDTNYSSTTSKHRNILRRIQREDSIQIVKDVPQDEFDLTNYLVNK